MECIQALLRSGSRSSLLGQRIEIISFFLKQAFIDQSFDRVEDCCARIWIVLTRFKQSMQINLVLLPKVKSSQNAFFDIIHDGM
jgi:hypothetical protein